MQKCPEVKTSRSFIERIISLVITIFILQAYYTGFTGDFNLGTFQFNYLVLFFSTMLMVIFDIKRYTEIREKKVIFEVLFDVGFLLLLIINFIVFLNYNLFNENNFFIGYCIGSGLFFAIITPTIYEGLNKKIISPYIPLKEFVKSREIQIMLKYIFVGRKNEIENLQNFLIDVNEKILLVTGRGGVGKTRLVIEFVKSVKTWNIYFIDHDMELCIMNFKRNTLLILDELSRYKDFNKLINLVKRPPLGRRKLKLICLDRTIFKDAIVRNLEIKQIHIKPFEIKEGNIEEFLQMNFKQISGANIDKIVTLSSNNFVYATFFAEFYLEKKNFGDLQKILSERIEKYIKDFIYECSSPNLQNIRRCFDTISLITPLNWDKDKNFLKEQLPETVYTVLEEILSIARLKNTDFLIYSNNTYQIKPDPIADYLRFRIIKRISTTFSFIMDYLPYMPFRIIYNIYIIPNFEPPIRNTVLTLLGDLWKRLNNIEGKTLEYFGALAFFIMKLSEHPSFLKRINIEKWTETYRNLSKTFSEKKVRDLFADILVLISATCAEEGNVTEEKITIIEKCLRKLNELYNVYSKEELAEPLAEALCSIILAYSKEKNIIKIEEHLISFKKLNTSHSNKEITKLFANSLYNATVIYRDMSNYSEMEEHMKALNVLYNHSKDEVAMHFAKALYNATHAYAQINNFTKMEEHLKLFNKLDETHSESELTEHFTRALYNATLIYAKINNFTKMEEHLTTLNLRITPHSEKEMVELLAKALANAILAYGNNNKFTQMEEHLVALNKLYNAHPEKLIISILCRALINAILAYEKINNLMEVEEHLISLKKLCNAHLEKEMIKILAKILFKVIYFYMKAKNFTKMEEHFSSLKKLYSTHPEKEIAELLAKALNSAAIIYLSENNDKKMNEYMHALKKLEASLSKE